MRDMPFEDLLISQTYSRAIEVEMLNTTRLLKKAVCFNVFHVWQEGCTLLAILGDQLFTDCPALRHEESVVFKRRYFPKRLELEESFRLVPGESQFDNA